MIVAQIDNSSPFAKQVIAFLKSLPFVKLEKTKIVDETLQAIKDADAGKNMTRTYTHEELMRKLRSKD